MSRTVDLFIESPLELPALADELRHRCGAQLLPTTDPLRWRFVDGSVDAELFAHPFLDDGDLWLSRYRYVLSARMADGVGPLDSAEVLSLRHLAHRLRDADPLPALLVLDLQYRLDAVALDAVGSDDQESPHYSDEAESDSDEARAPTEGAGVPGSRP